MYFKPKTLVKLQAVYILFEYLYFDIIDYSAKVFFKWVPKYLKVIVDLKKYLTSIYLF